VGGEYRFGKVSLDCSPGLFILQYYFRGFV